MRNKKLILSNIRIVQETIRNLTALRGQIDYTFAIEDSKNDLKFLRQLYKDHGFQDTKKIS